MRLYADENLLDLFAVLLYNYKKRLPIIKIRNSEI